jgi:hypothetical protein
VVVVDPGVGTRRKAIAAVAGDYVFVGPDNGVFDLVFDELPPSRVVELTNARYALAVISRTFEGRDRFAPAAAWLASGVTLTDLGPAVTVQRRLNFPRPSTSAGSVDGEVVHIDRFGNLVTNIDRRAWPGDVVDRLDVAVSGYRTVRLVATYAEAGLGEVVALFGGTDRLEIAVRSGNAAEALGVGRGTTVHVSRRA